MQSPRAPVPRRARRRLVLAARRRPISAVARPIERLYLHVAEIQLELTKHFPDERAALALRHNLDNCPDVGDRIESVTAQRPSGESGKNGCVGNSRTDP